MATGFIQRFSGKIVAKLITMTQGGQFLASTQSGIVAGTTQTQAGATPINAMQAQIATAAVGDGVALPRAVPGMEVVLLNNGAGATCKVYGTNPDTINGVATATGVTQANGGNVTIYYCFVAGDWRTK